MQKLHTACANYNDWKASNKPEFKPWLNPDQNPLPLYSSEGQPQGAPSNTDPDSEGAEEGQNGQDLDTVPEGMEQYQTMDMDDELTAAVNGVGSNCS
jgi:hypothetical protein